MIRSDELQSVKVNKSILKPNLKNLNNFGKQLKLKTTEWPAVLLRCSGNQPGESLAFTLFMNVVKCLKKPLTVEEQIKKLKAHNMLIHDEDIAAEILGHINYYRFSGYALQFRVFENDSNFVQGTTFNDVYEIYRFDEELRSLLRIYIEKLEIYFRTIIAYHFSLAKCTLPPHDQHYDDNNFFNKKGYQQLRDHFNRDRDYYRDSLVLKHHAKNYNDKLPLWVIVELISFSDLSKLYSCMFYSEKERIAKVAGVGISETKVLRKIWIFMNSICNKIICCNTVHTRK